MLSPSEILYSFKAKLLLLTLSSATQQPKLKYRLRRASQGLTGKCQCSETIGYNNELFLECVYLIIFE